MIRALFGSKSLPAASWFEIEARLQKSSSSSRPSDIPIEPSVTLAPDPPVMADQAINSGYLVVSPIDGAPSLSAHQDSTAEFGPASKASASRSSESDTLLNPVRVASK